MRSARGFELRNAPRPEGDAERFEEGVMKLAAMKPVTGIARAGIYLAFALSIVWLIYITGSFIYALTHADGGGNLATNIYVMPELQRGADRAIYESQNGAVRYRLDEVYGVLTWLNMPRRIAFAVYFQLFVLWLLFFIAVRELANLFEDVGAGKPFVAENARRLRIVGTCMAGGAIFRMLFVLVSLRVFHDDVMIPGARFPWKFVLTQDLNLGLILGGFVVLAISEVFRIGNRLQEDQELTV